MPETCHRIHISFTDRHCLEGVGESMVLPVWLSQSFQLLSIRDVRLHLKDHMEKGKKWLMTTSMTGQERCHACTSDRRRWFMLVGGKPGAAVQIHLNSRGSEVEEKVLQDGFDVFKRIMF